MYITRGWRGVKPNPIPALSLDRARVILLIFIFSPALSREGVGEGFN
jgi:hypothetical protein